LYRAPNLWESPRFSTLRVYDGATGELQNLIGSFADPVETFAYAPDGRTLAVAFADGTLRLWDLAADKVVFSAQHFNHYAFDVDYSADGDYLLLQTPDELIVRRTSDGALRGRYAAETFATSPVENVAALAAGGELRLLDLATGNYLTSWAAHAGGVSSLAFSPDGALLVSAGLDCVIREWAAETGEFVHNFAENWTDAYGEGDWTLSRIFIDALQFIPGTDTLLGYGSWSRVVGWDTNSGATEYFIEPEPLEYYSGMQTLNPHFPEFFGIDQAAGAFYVDNAAYAVEDGAFLGQAELPENLPAGCAPAGPLTADGLVRFTRGYDAHAGQVCVLNAQTLALQATITVIPPEAVDSAPSLGWLYLSPDGGQLAVTVGGESVYIYQLADSAAPVVNYQAQ
jgi:WD40 repeat protein